MASYFKVWVQIEKIVDTPLTKSCECEDVGLPDPLGEFNTLTEAAEFVRKLPGWEACAATSDYRTEVIRNGRASANLSP